MIEDRWWWGVPGFSFSSSVHIDGCELVDLKVFADERGWLVPVLSDDSPKVLYCYYSITHPDAARDIDTWHIHRAHTDRFVVMTSCAIFGLSDGKVMERVMLFATAPRLLVVPPGIYHCFRPCYEEDVYLLNIPTEIYDPGDEGRVPFDNLPVERPW